MKLKGAEGCSPQPQNWRRRREHEILTLKQVGRISELMGGAQCCSAPKTLERQVDVQWAQGRAALGTTSWRKFGIGDTAIQLPPGPEMD